MHLDATDVLLVLIGFQSWLFAFILIGTKGPKQISNRLLAGFLLTLAAQMSFLVALDFLPPSFDSDSCLCVFGFFYGPLLFLYTHSLIHRSFLFQSGAALHFIPGVVLIIGAGLGVPLCQWAGPVLYFHLITYTVLAIRAIIRYRGIVKNTRSSTAKIDLAWLQWTMVVFVLVLLSDIIDHYLVDLSVGPNISIVHIILLLLVNGMFFKGIRQPQIFLGISTVESDISHLNTEKESLPLDEKSESELKKLQQYLQDKHVFTDPELSLVDLAEQLNMSPRRLSQLINTHLNQNFMQFINSYRIELAKERLANPREDGETIQEVMYDVGFNSKSSFNTLFKLNTGLTPTEFKRRHKS